MWFIDSSVWFICFYDLSQANEYKVHIVCLQLWVVKSDFYGFYIWILPGIGSTSCSILMVICKVSLIDFSLHRWAPHPNQNKLGTKTTRLCVTHPKRLDKYVAQVSFFLFYFLVLLFILVSVGHTFLEKKSNYQQS